MERGNLLSKIRKQYGNVYEDSKNRHTQALSNPIKNKYIDIDNKSLTQLLKELSSRTAVETELFIKQLDSIAKYATDNDLTVLKKRIQFLQDKAHYMIHALNKIVMISTKDLGQATFLFDNLNTINQIILAKRIPEFEQYNLYKTLNPCNYTEFLKLAQKNKMGSKFTAEFIYNQNPHNIGFGQEIIRVDSGEIISLLTGISSITCAKTSNYENTNKIIKSLVVNEYKDQNIEASELTEAILTQKPALAQIAKKYIELNAKWNTWLDDAEDVIRKQEQFFNNLNKKEILPQELELKTMIPDKNALTNPQQTLELFYEKLTG